MKEIKTANYKKVSNLGGFLNKINPFGNNPQKILEDISTQASELSNELINYDDILPEEMASNMGEAFTGLLPQNQRRSSSNIDIKESQQQLSPKIIALMDKVKAFRDNLTKVKTQLQNSPKLNVIDNFLNNTVSFGQVMSNPSNSNGYSQLAEAFSNLSINLTY
jgi:hypothetical protein